MRVTIFVLLGVIVVAASPLFQTGNANTTTESLASPAIASPTDARGRAQTKRPGAVEQYVATKTSTNHINSIPDVANLDLQLRIAPPPDIVLRKPLPYIYCEKSNQFVFIYPSESGDQYYRLRPAKRESYLELFRQVIAGSRFPWALRLRGANYYLINAAPEDKQKFDYQVSAVQFESCAELAKLPRSHLLPRQQG